MRQTAVAAFRWLAEYRTEWLRPDLVAGLTLAAYLLPAGIGDASLAGLPPEAGLYACLFSGLVFWLFCSSQHTVITVTSALSLLIAASVGELSGGDPARHAALAACVALMVARSPLPRGWCAPATPSASSQRPFSSASRPVWRSTWRAHSCRSCLASKARTATSGSARRISSRHLGETHPMSLARGRRRPGGPGCRQALAEEPARGVPRGRRRALSRRDCLNLEAHGVALLGDVPQGLPSLGLPLVSRHELNELLPLALACFVLAAVETSAIGRMFGQKHGYRFDANQELLALGAGNLLAGLGRGFPVSGGMSQSLVNESAGARTPLSGLVAAVFTLFVVLFASGLLRNLPQPVLAAIVLAAVMGLVDIHALRHIWRFSRGGVLRGDRGASSACSDRGRSTACCSAPRFRSCCCSGRPPARGSPSWPASPARPISPIVRATPRTNHVPGVLVVRCESSLLYFNVEHVRERLFELLNARPDAVRLVVFFLGRGSEHRPRRRRAPRRSAQDAARARHRRSGWPTPMVRCATRCDESGSSGEHGPLESGQTVDVLVSQWQASALVPDGIPPR